MTTQFSLLVQTQNPTDYSSVSEERTRCSVPAPSAVTSAGNGCTGRGVRVKGSDLAVVTLGVRCVPAAVKNAARKLHVLL